MAWTYFTAYLDGTRPIRKEERDELFDQFAAKLALGCPPVWSLDSTYLTTIKASTLLTSRVMLKKTGFSVSGPLEPVIGYATDSFGNMADARATSLSLEGLTEADITAITAQSLDSYKGWNFLKRWIEDMGPNIGVNIDPTVVARTSSASKSKCGEGEFSGHYSPPQKIYKRILDEWSCDDASGSGVNYAYENHQLTTRCVETVTSGGDYSAYSACAVGGVPASETVTTTATTQLVHRDYVTVGGYVNYLRTLSDEYTNVELSAEVDAAMPAFSGAFTGTLYAYTNLNADENGMTKIAVQYKFILPDLTGFVGYLIAWNEVTYFDGGGSSSVPKSYFWDGVATETPVYTLTPPSANGHTVIESMTGLASC